MKGVLLHLGEGFHFTDQSLLLILGEPHQLVEEDAERPPVLGLPQMAQPPRILERLRNPRHQA